MSHLRDTPGGGVEHAQHKVEVSSVKVLIEVVAVLLLLLCCKSLPQQQALYLVCERKDGKLDEIVQNIVH